MSVKNGNRIEILSRTECRSSCSRPLQIPSRTVVPSVDCPTSEFSLKEFPRFVVFSCMAFGPESESEPASRCTFILFTAPEPRLMCSNAGASANTEDVLVWTREG